MASRGSPTSRLALASQSSPDVAKVPTARWSPGVVRATAGRDPPRLVLVPWRRPCHRGPRSSPTRVGPPASCVPPRAAIPPTRVGPRRRACHRGPRSPPTRVGPRRRACHRGSRSPRRLVLVPWRCDRPNVPWTELRVGSRVGPRGRPLPSLSTPCLARERRLGQLGPEMTSTPLLGVHSARQEVVRRSHILRVSICYTVL
jgi:hypothetical protein